MKNKPYKKVDIIFGIITTLIVLLYIYFIIDTFIKRANLSDDKINLYPVGQIFLNIYFIIPFIIDLIFYISITVVMIINNKYRFLPFYSISLIVYLLSLIMGFLLLPLLGN